MLSHTVLRRAAIEALCPAAVPAGGPWPTIADDRVFDSRIAPIDSLFGDEAKPTICLYTEDVAAQAGSAPNGLPHQAAVTLVIEVGARAAVRSGEGEDLVVDIATAPSDPALEAMVDTLAAQVYHRLVLDPPGPFFQARRRISRYESLPYRDGEGGQKVAIRALSLTVDLPTFSRPADALAQAAAVAALLPVGSPGRVLIDAGVADLSATIGFREPGNPVPSMLGIDLTARPASAAPGPTDIVATVP